MSFWVLQQKYELPGKRQLRFWAGEDYTDDARRALRFPSQGEAMEWLTVHSYLRPYLRPVEVEETEHQ